MPKTPIAPRKRPGRDPFRGRKCLHCGLTFKPTCKNPFNAEEAKFCCPAHRKEFWKYGKLPWDKLMARVENRAREVYQEESLLLLAEVRKSIIAAESCIRDIARQEIGTALMKIQLDNTRRSIGDDTYHH